nr:MAG TPA: hypothetical protein [Caudoviricetes sp.]
MFALKVLSKIKKTLNFFVFFVDKLSYKIYNILVR